MRLWRVCAPYVHCARALCGVLDWNLAEQSNSRDPENSVPFPGTFLLLVFTVFFLLLSCFLHGAFLRFPAICDQPWMRGREEQARQQGVHCLLYQKTMRPSTQYLIAANFPHKEGAMTLAATSSPLKQVYVTLKPLGIHAIDIESGATPGKESSCHVSTHGGRQQQYPRKDFLSSVDTTTTWTTLPHASKDQLAKQPTRTNHNLPS